MKVIQGYMQYKQKGAILLWKNGFVRPVAPSFRPERRPHKNARFAAMNASMLAIRDKNGRRREGFPEYTAGARVPSHRHRDQTLLCHWAACTFNTNRTGQYP